MSKEHGILLDMEIAGESYESAGEASSKLKRVLQQIGVASEVIRRIAISAYEAEMNVIIHATRGHMSALIYPDRTELTIKDEGPGIADIELALQEGYSTAPDYIRELGFGAGMGLPNMVRCADKFHIDSIVGKGTTIQIVIFHKKE